MKYILTLKTGLHIGASDDAMKIGGVDSPVLKRKVFYNENGEVDLNSDKFIIEPYIPGSSLKGKIRSLLEHYFKLHNKILEVYREKEKKFIELLQNNNINYIRDFETLDKKKDKEKSDEEKKLLRSIKETQEYKEYDKIKKQKGNPINSKILKYFDEEDKENAKNIVLMFGESAGNSETNEITIPRVIFRDCFITKEVRKKAALGKIELSEEKMENVIDRISSTTRGGGLRQIERVPAGVEFEVEISIRDFGDKEKFEELLKTGLKLLENDYLGGSGTRGYGQVEFKEVKDENI